MPRVLIPAPVGLVKPPSPPTGEIEINYASPQADGLVGFFPMLYGQGAQFRELVTGAHGTFSGSTGLIHTAFGPGIDMTTGGSYVTATGSELPLEPGDYFTWLIWVDIRGSGTRGLLHKGNNSSAQRAVQMRTDGTVRFLVVASDSFDSTQTPTGLTLIGLTNDDLDMQMFINGQYENGKTTFLSPADTSAYPLYIGTDTLNTCDSVIHEVRVYNRVLSADEMWQAYDEATRWDLHKPVARLWTGIDASEPETGYAVPIVARAEPLGPSARSLRINYNSPQAAGLIFAANFTAGNISGVWNKGGVIPWTSGTKGFAQGVLGHGCYSSGTQLDLRANGSGVASLVDRGTIMMRIRQTTKDTAALSTILGAVSSVDGNDFVVFANNGFVGGDPMCFTVRTSDGYQSATLNESNAFAVDTTYLYAGTWEYDGSTGYDQRLLRLGGGNRRSDSGFDLNNKQANPPDCFMFWWNDTPAGYIFEARLYDRILDDDLIYAMWDPLTAWDLYKPVERLWAGWHETEEEAAVSLFGGELRGVLQGTLRGVG